MPPSFFGFLTARATVSLANTMLTISIGWHLYQNSGDPFDLALVGLMQIIPIFLFFFVTGWAVDSLPRKMILIICSVSEAIILAALTSVMLADVLNVTFVFGLLFLHGASKAFYTPAQQAIIPNIVPEDFVSRAVALTATIGKVFSTLSFGRPLITVIDFYTYLVAAGLMLVSAAAYLWLPRLAHATHRAKPKYAYCRNYICADKLHCLWRHRFGFVHRSGGSVMALLPVYATDVLQVGDALGMLRGAPAFGGVIIGFTMAALPPMRRSGLCLFVALVVFSASIAVFAFSTIFWVSLLALCVYGAADMVSVNVRMPLIQLATPDHLRGRVSAVNSIFISSSNELGDVRSGSVAAILGPVPTVFIGSLMAFGVTFGGWYLFPKLRQLDRLTDARPPTDEIRT